MRNAARAAPIGVLGFAAILAGVTLVAGGALALLFLDERAGIRGLLVRTRLNWARLLLRRNEPGDADRARTLATAAAELADEFDAPLLVERGLQLLGRSPMATG